jgi:hypothetical protein
MTVDGVSITVMAATGVLFAMMAVTFAVVAVAFAVVPVAFDVVAVAFAVVPVAFTVVAIVIAAVAIATVDSNLGFKVRIDAYRVVLFALAAVVRVLQDHRFGNSFLNILAWGRDQESRISVPSVFPC